MRPLKQTLIFVTQLFFFIVCFAQYKEIDSLKKMLPELKDTKRIDCMNELSFQYIRLLKRDSAEYFEASAYKESEKINYIHGIAESISNQSGIYEYFDNDFIKAEALAKESIILFEKAANKSGIEKAYDNLSFAFFSESKYEEDYRLAERQYKKSVAAKDSSKICDALSSIGVIHFQQGNYDSAFYYYEEARQIAIAQKNEVLISDYPIGLGTLYRAIGDYSNALKNYRQVFQTDTRETIQRRIDRSYETWTRMEFAELFSLQRQYDSAWHYYNLFDTTGITDKDLRIYLVSTGETYFLQGDYKKALQNFLRGLAMHKKLNDRNEIKRVLLDIAKTYLALKDNGAALKYARKGLDLSLQTKSRQFVRDGYQIFYWVYDRLHKTDSAYFYYQKYMAAKEIVVSDQTKGRFAAYSFEQKIELLNKEKENQQAQLQKQAILKNILIGGIISLFLFAAIIFRNIVLKRLNEVNRRELAENELQLQKLESEKTKSQLHQQATKLELQALRSQMNPHFIFNCLNSINRFIINNDAAKAADYLTKFAKLIRIVLEQSGKPFIALEDEICWLKLYMDLEALRFEKPFQYKINLNGTNVSSVMIPTMLIQPFVENAIWHGLHPKNNGVGEIVINTHLQDNTLHCSIYDNGVGRPASVINEEKGRNSLGINITEHRLQLINAANQKEAGIEIHDLVNEEGQSSGTCVDIKIPVKEM